MEVFALMVMAVWELSILACTLTFKILEWTLQLSLILWQLTVWMLVAGAALFGFSAAAGVSAYSAYKDRTPGAPDRRKYRRPTNHRPVNRR